MANILEDQLMTVAKVIEKQLNHQSPINEHYYIEYETSTIDADANIDQISAAENLIFMARDRQVDNDVDAHTTTQDQREMVSSASNDMSTQGSDYIYDANTTVDYTDTTPQMVTEEVITDDWVQRQGAERVEIPADQILSSSQVVLDIEVPLPTVQDEYTALRPYPCDFCSRRFRKKASLMNHMVAHQNDRPNLCKLCGSRFFRRSDLISHLKAHAETPEEDDNVHVDLSGFVGQNSEKQINHQSSIDDHYYDYDCDYSHRNSKEVNKLSNGNGNNNSLSTIRTGRVSRLKPKKPACSVEEMHETEIGAQHHQIQVNCQEIKPSAASAKFTQEKQEQNYFYNVIDDSKPFVCQQCGLAFAREKALFAHVKNHRNEAPYECDQCNEMFWDRDSLQDHQKTHQFEASNSEYDPDEVGDETQSDSDGDPLYGEFYCNECGVSFHRHDLLMRHSKTHMRNNNVVELDKSGQHCCNTCGETFEEALDLLAHAEIHARYPPFKCVLCGESFFEESTIKRHLLSQHENAMTINSCILCGKECRDRKALIKHAWDHSREKCHSCSKCGKSFHNKARLKRHMTSHRDKSVICNICFEEFPDGRTLSNHRHSHSNNSAGKLFPCHECGKTFGSRSSQQIHVRIHTGEKPYGCRYCWKAFADGGTLRKHERIHTGEKPYVCSVCSRAFNQRVVLREHIRSHHSGLDIKRGTYFCTLCQENLPTSSDLVQHLIQHSDVNTAKQRKPIAGPRKYKRRRKLKPHEIERLRNVADRGEDLNESDVDITDIDDLLAITEESSASKNRKRSKSTRITRNECLKKSSRTTNHVKSKLNDSIESLVVDDMSNSSRTRYSMTNSNTEKLFNTRLGNTITHQHDESLLLNVENTLQSIDALVVGTEPESNYSKPQESKAQRTQQFQPKRNTKYNNSSTVVENVEIVRNRRRAQNITKQLNRPHMIHTEKNRNRITTNNIASNTTNIDNKQRRTTTTTTRMLISRNESSSTSISSPLELLPSKTMTIVDDYEIISPATQPPHQISSSPIHIKQEDSEVHFQNYRQLHHQQQHQQQQQLHQLHQQQKQLLQETNTENYRRRRYLTSQSSQTSRSSDLYDAQLLLDAATLRKDCYEKFNPNIVNDLEEILRSPLKSDKIGERMRNTNECSTTQYIGDQSEEEAGLIKLEPSSPDFQSLFNSNNAHKTPERTRTSRNRQVTPNRRYLEFETVPSSTMKTTRQTTSKQTNKRATISNAFDNAKKNSSRKKIRKNSTNTSATLRNNYPNTTFDVCNASSVRRNNANTTAELEHDYDTISTIDSAAAAVQEAAEAAAAQAKATEKPTKYYFECEMCSMVFTDRAQLLDHVPIHI